MHRSSSLKRGTSLIAFFVFLLAPFALVAQSAISPAIPAKSKPKPKPIILAQPARPAVAPQNPLIVAPVLSPTVRTTADANYWSNRLLDVRREALDLTASIGEIRHQIETLSGDGLREDLVQNQLFVTQLQQLSERADRWIAPQMVQALAWSATEAAESGEILKQKLERQQVEAAARLPILQARMAAKQIAISRNSDLQGVLSGIIEAQRSGYDIDSKISELKVLDTDATAKAAPTNSEANNKKF